MQSSLSFSEYEEKQAVPQRSINIEIPHASVRFEKQEPPLQRYARAEASRPSQPHISSTTSHSNQFQHQYSSVSNEAGLPPTAHAETNRWEPYREPVIQDMLAAPALGVPPVVPSATQSHLAVSSASSFAVKQAPSIINTTQSFVCSSVSSSAPKDFVQPNAAMQTFPKTDQIETLQAESVLILGLQSYGATPSTLQSEYAAGASASEPAKPTSDNQDPDPPRFCPEKTPISAHEQPVAPCEIKAEPTASENKTPSLSPVADDPVLQHESQTESSFQHDSLPQSSVFSSTKSVSTTDSTADIEHEMISSINEVTEVDDRVDAGREQQLDKQEPSNISKITSVHDSFGSFSDSMASDGMVFTSHDASGGGFSPLESKQTVDLTLSIVNSFDSSVSNAAMTSVSQSQSEATAKVVLQPEAETKSDLVTQIAALNSVESLDRLEESQSALSPDRAFGSSSMVEMSSSPGRTDEDQIKLFNASADSFSHSVIELESNEQTRDSPLVRSPAAASRLEDSAVKTNSATRLSNSKAPSSLLQERAVVQEAPKAEVSDAQPAESWGSENSIKKKDGATLQGSESPEKAVPAAAEEKPVAEVRTLTAVLYDFIHQCISFPNASCM